jgi:RNA polymerase primary sigma factor
MAENTRPAKPQAQPVARKGVTRPRPSRSLSAGQREQVQRILTGRYEYIDNDMFDLPDEQAVEQLFAVPDPTPMPDTSWYQPVMHNVAGNRQNKQLGSVLLTAAQERVIFLQYNYCRMRVCRLRDELLDSPRMRPTVARQMLSWHDKAEDYRDQLAQINLALVLAMAKRTRMNEMDFGDMVSEGNMALLRAIDKFDAARGFKFSTYGCRAILKAFSRAGVKLSRYRGMFPTEYDPAYEQSNHSDLKRIEHELDCADEVKVIFKRNDAELTDIEQEVIEHRFHVLQGPTKGIKPQPRQLTLEQVGKLIGVTKERVRQIQNKALDKIRNTLEEGYLA